MDASIASTCTSGFIRQLFCIQLLLWHYAVMPVIMQSAEIDEWYKWRENRGKALVPNLLKFSSVTNKKLFSNKNMHDALLHF